MFIEHSERISYRTIRTTVIVKKNTLLFIGGGGGGLVGVVGIRIVICAYHILRLVIYLSVVTTRSYDLNSYMQYYRNYSDSTITTNSKEQS